MCAVFAMDGPVVIWICWYVIEGAGSMGTVPLGGRGPGQGFLGGVRGVGLHPRRLSPQGQLWCLILINRGKAQPGSHQTPMAVVWWVMRVSKRNTQPNGMVGWTDRLVHCMLIKG